METHRLNSQPGRCWCQELNSIFTWTFLKRQINKFLSKSIQLANSSLLILNAFKSSNKSSFKHEEELLKSKMAANGVYTGLPTVWGRCAPIRWCKRWAIWQTWTASADKAARSRSIPGRRGRLEKGRYSRLWAECTYNPRLLGLGVQGRSSKWRPGLALCSCGRSSSSSMNRQDQECQVEPSRQNVESELGLVRDVYQSSRGRGREPVFSIKPSGQAEVSGIMLRVFIFKAYFSLFFKKLSN